MSCCSVCNQQKNKLFPESEDCVEAALDKIKKHYLYFKNALEEKEQRLQSLQERNEKLQKVVDMLQRSPPASNNSVSPKRRKATTRSIQLMDESPIVAHVDLSISDDGAPELNMALNSEQMFDCTVWSPSRNESIAETEKVRSPRVLRTPGRWGTRRELKDKTKPFVEVNTANGRAIKSEWISKECKAGPSAPNTSTFLKPQTTGSASDEACLRNEKKASLSLKKKDSHNKLRQTRLQLTPIRKTSLFANNNSTSCEEAIGASPNLDEPLKQSKTKRSCFQRTDNNVTNANASKVSTANPKIELNLCTNSKQKMDSSSVDDLLPLSAEETQSNSSSVLMMTPATQEIIFLDDTYDAAHIESMDLMRDLMKVGDDASLNNLKRIENEGIKKLQLKKPKVTKEEDEREQPMTSKQSNQMQKAKASVNVKQENITQDPNNLMEKENYSEELEEEFPLPILVKEERLSGAPAKRLSVMERFKVDCRDCQNYIKFRGDYLSDKELEEHLRNCTRHKERDALIPQTPEDFWNPLIVPFNSDDPRNEVLIDSRFVGKKRSK